MQKGYVSIEVPLRRHCKWLVGLKQVFRTAGISYLEWKKYGSHHITLAFLDEMPEYVIYDAKVAHAVKNASMQTITFDRLDAFLAQSGTKYVISLTTSRIPEVGCPI